MRRTVPRWLWFAAGCAVVAAEMVGFASTVNWDVTALLQVGEDSPARPIIEEELGPVAILRTQGHDGKYFYLIARHPWFWTADERTRHGVQDPAYRYGRPLYPLLAGLGGTLSPRATFVGMLLIQIVCGGFLSVVLSEFAKAERWGVFSVLFAMANPGVHFAAITLTSDLLALTATIAGLHLWRRGAWKWSLLAFAAAALAKEYYALTPLAVAASLLLQKRVTASFVFAMIPLLPVIAWRLAVSAVLGSGEGAGNFTWPGLGVAEAMPGWKDFVIPLGACALILVAGGVFGALRPGPAWLRLQCAVWTLLALAASHLVWDDPSDLVRVVSPLWVFVVWSAGQAMASSAARTP